MITEAESCASTILALWVARSFLSYITSPVARQWVHSLPCAGAQNAEEKKVGAAEKKKERESSTSFDEQFDALAPPFLRV